MVNNKLYIFLILFCNSLILKSQQTEKLNNSDRKGYTSLNIGTNFPTGSFGSTNFNNIESGYATSGITIDFNFGYKINKNIGFKSMYRSQSNGKNISEYEFDMENFLGKDYPTGTTFVNIESSSFIQGSLMGGLNGSFQIKENIKFEPYVLLGYSSSTLPYMYMEVYYQEFKRLTTIQEQANTVSLSYVLGASTKIDLSKQICLFINLDFGAFKAKWQDVRVISIGHSSRTTEVRYYNYEQKFSNINFSGGIGFKF